MKYGQSNIDWVLSKFDRILMLIAILTIMMHFNFIAAKTANL
jgi:hypothetical protein